MTSLVYALLVLLLIFLLATSCAIALGNHLVLSAPWPPSSPWPQLYRDRRNDAGRASLLFAVGLLAALTFGIIGGGVERSDLNERRLDFLDSSDCERTTNATCCPCSARKEAGE